MLYFLLVDFLTSNEKFYIYIYIYIYILISFFTFSCLTMVIPYYINMQRNPRTKRFSWSLLVWKNKAFGRPMILSMFANSSTAANSTNMQSRVTCEDKNLCLAVTAYLQWHKHITHTDIATYRLNWPRGHYSKKYLHISIFFSLLMN